MTSSGERVARDLSEIISSQEVDSGIDDTGGVATGIVSGIGVVVVDCDIGVCGVGLGDGGSCSDVLLPNRCHVFAFRTRSG
jgi:hypothetical protein